MNADQYEIKRALDSSHREYVELLTDILNHLKRAERSDRALLEIFVAAVQEQGCDK